MFEDLEEECALGLGVTPFSLSMDVEMRLENGAFVTSVGTPVFGANVRSISDCFVSDAVDTLLGQDPAMISNLITDMMADELNDIPSSVEDSLNDVIDDLTINETVDLLGEGLDVLLEPTAVYLNEDGVVLGFGSEMSLDVRESCILPEAFDPPEQAPDLTEKFLILR